MKKLLLVLLLMSVTAGTALSATRYITDQLSVTMRHGQGTQYRVVETLNSGQAVQVIRNNSGTGYSKVRTPDGEQGWVLTRFLSDTAGARQRLNAAQKKLDQLRTKNQTLQGKLNTLQGDQSTLSGKVSKLGSENETLKARLQDITSKASHTLEISRTNKKLRAQLVSLKADRARLQYQNKALKSRRRGLEIGALILFAGLILGLIIPKLRLRRRSSW